MEYYKQKYYLSLCGPFITTPGLKNGKGCAMAKLKSFDVVREKWLRDYEVKEDYDALGPEFQIAAQIIKARTNARMAQAELAEKVGTKATAISRIESPNTERFPQEGRCSYFSVCYRKQVR
jgi:hypothetical protein